MAKINMFLMKLPVNLTSETMLNKILWHTMGHGQQRVRHRMLKCGRTGVLLEIRVLCLEPLVLCAQNSACDVNLIFL
jgi:hypothetical protein